MVVRRIQSDELYHHGVKGQRWGYRRYQNKDGSLTSEGKKKYGSIEKFEKNRQKMAGVAIAAQAANTLLQIHNFKEPYKNYVRSKARTQRAKSLNLPSKIHEDSTKYYKNEAVGYGILAGVTAATLGALIVQNTYLHNKNKKLIDKELNKSISSGKKAVEKRRDIYVETIDGDVFKITNGDNKTYEKYKKDSRIKSVNYK